MHEGACYRGQIGAHFPLRKGTSFVPRASIARKGKLTKSGEGGKRRRSVRKVILLLHSILSVDVALPCTGIVIYFAIGRGS